MRLRLDSFYFSSSFLAAFSHNGGHVITVVPIRWHVLDDVASLCVPLGIYVLFTAKGAGLLTGVTRKPLTKLATALIGAPSHMIWAIVQAPNSGFSRRKWLSGWLRPGVLVTFFFHGCFFSMVASHPSQLCRLVLGAADDTRGALHRVMGICSHRWPPQCGAQ